MVEGDNRCQIVTVPDLELTTMTEINLKNGLEDLKENNRERFRCARYSWYPNLIGGHMIPSGNFVAVLNLETRNSITW